MRISLSPIRYTGISYQNSTKAITNKPNNVTNPYRNVTFMGYNVLSENNLPKSNEDYFNDFAHSMKHVYKDKPINEVCAQIIEDDDNFYAEGNSKIVYLIPDVSDYLICKIKDSKESSPYAPIVPCENNLERYNFGEPIATNGNDILISRKINGFSHSFSNWGARCFDIMEGHDCVSRKEAVETLVKINKIKDFPVKAYVDLAKQIKYLSENGYKADSINPNNIIIDDKKKKFSLIDLPENYKQIMYKGELKEPFNTVHDMINLLSDGLMQLEYEKVLTESEKAWLEDCTKQIIEKSFIAAKYTGLETDGDNIWCYYKFTDKLACGRRGRYSDFYQRYMYFREKYNIDDKIKESKND